MKKINKTMHLKSGLNVNEPYYVLFFLCVYLLPTILILRTIVNRPQSHRKFLNLAL